MEGIDVDAIKQKRQLRTFGCWTQVGLTHTNALRALPQSANCNIHVSNMSQYVKLDCTGLAPHLVLVESSVVDRSGHDSYLEYRKRILLAW